jgi:hypothetical protein
MTGKSLYLGNLSDAITYPELSINFTGYGLCVLLLRRCVAPMT